MFIGIFIDDQGEQETIAQLLSDDNYVSFEFIKPYLPISDMAEIILDKKPDIVALDYRLDESPCGEPGQVKPNRYKAGPLAQQLRDQALSQVPRDFPIVLVSQEDNIRNLYEPDRTAHNLFDEIFLKNEVVGNPEDAISKVRGLITGYKIIIENWDSPNRLPSILNIDPLLASPQEIESIDASSAPHQLARSILQYFIHRNGILIDIFGLVSMLGLDAESSDMSLLIDHLDEQGIAYQGAFSIGWKRFVRDSVDAWASGVCGEPIDMLGALTIVNRLRESTGIELVPAKSRWQPQNFDPIFSVPCSSCQLPTELDYSVPAYDPVVFGFVQKKVICWDCIATGRYQEAGLKVDETGLFISEKIENGEIVKE